VVCGWVESVFAMLVLLAGGGASGCVWGGTGEDCGWSWRTAAKKK
jgi:hypothetical protein